MRPVFFLFILIVGLFVSGFPVVSASDGVVNNSLSGEFHEFEPEEEMIFEVRLDNRYMLERSLFAYYRDDKAYLPLAEICRLLEFPVSTNSRNGTAAGWFLNENRRFALDTENLQVISDSQKFELSKDDFRRLSDDIYVTAESLTRWFPIKVEESFRTLSINITAEEKLPIIQRMEREARWFRLRPSERQALMPLKKMPYQFFSSPFADVSISSDFIKGNKQGIPSRYSVFMANDTLFHTSELYASGNEKDGLTAARWKMSWADESEEQKSWLGYNTYTIGDLTPAAMPLIPALRSGRGIYFSNTPLNYSSEFSSTTISGNLPEGWSAELYRGKSLVETIAPDQSRDEMYFFENVPILTGNNDFSVKLYGPYGEIREEKKNFFVGSGMISPEKTFYKIFALQNNKEMLPVKKNYAISEDGYTFRSEFTRGINNNLTLKHDFAGITENNERQIYSTIEAIGSLEDTDHLSAIHGSIGLVSQVDAGNALMMRARSNLAGWNIANEFLNFGQNFSFSNTGLNTDWRNSLNLSGRLLNSHSMSVKWLHDSFHNNNYSDAINLNLSSRIGQSNILNSFDYRLNKSDGIPASSYSEGNTEIRTRVGQRAELTAGVDYLLEPDLAVRTFGFGGRWQGEDNLSFSAQIRRYVAQQINNQKSIAYNFGLLKKFQDFSTGLQMSGDNSGDLRVMFSLNSSFGVLPESGKLAFNSDSMVRSGGVVVKVLQKTSAGKIPLKDVVITAGGRRGITDASGTAVLVGLSPSLRVDVSVEAVSLIDPFLVVESPEVSVIPRPGAFHQLTYYVVMTSEIEGKVFFQNESEKKVVGGVQLELADCKTSSVVGKARTDGDGFFIFDFIRPGSYFIDIDKQQGENLGVFVANKGMIKISEDGAILTKDVILQDISMRPVILQPDFEAIRQLDVPPPLLVLDSAQPYVLPAVDSDVIRLLNIEPPDIISAKSVDQITDIVIEEKMPEILQELNVAPPDIFPLIVKEPSKNSEMNPLESYLGYESKSPVPEIPAAVKDLQNQSELRKLNVLPPIITPVQPEKADVGVLNISPPVLKLFN